MGLLSPPLPKILLPPRSPSPLKESTIYGEGVKIIFPDCFFFRVFLETIISDSGEFKMTPHFSIGRISGERGLVMPDNKTVYVTEDAYNQGFYKFVAETAGDLSSGSFF